MGYLVLARKWRPQNFEDLIGQDTIVTILKNALLENRIAHAYLFSGPRGVGKTSAARILAKSLNCGSGPTGNPCGICGSCKAIVDGSSVDVIEIDGASNNSVDDIRDLREKVKYAPSGSRFKVYIIDETHMLSQSAFNALLKTLEEPPPHVIFVLATTAPNKVITTVLSRCQHLPFRRIPSEKIKQRLRMISDAEELSISDKAVEIIAKAADGSMRDSLTLIDQISSFSTDITDADVKDMLGISDISSIILVAEALLKGDREKIVEVINRLYEMGTDLKLFIRDLIQFIRNILILSITHSNDMLLELDKNEAHQASELLLLTNEETLTAMLNELIRAEAIIRSAYSPRIALEMSLIKISFLNTIRPINAIIEDVSQFLESQPRSSTRSLHQSPERTNPEKKKDQSGAPITSQIKREEEHLILSDVDKNGLEKAEKEIYCTLPESIDHEKDEKLWIEALKKIYSANHVLGCKLSDARITADGDKIHIVFNGGHSVHADSVKKHKKFIEDIMREISGKTSQVSIKTEESHPLSDITGEVLSSPVIRDALDLFEGKIVDVKKKTK